MMMYGQKPLQDIGRFVRAAATNQFARRFPERYFTLVNDTGRGPDSETESGLAQYALRCFLDYLERLDGDAHHPEALFEGRAVLEYGPGDFPGVAVLMVAYGARRVALVDRFPLLRMSDFNRRAYDVLVDALNPPQRARARAAFGNGDPSTWNRAVVQSVVSPSGLSGAHGEFDFVLSRAVLEHVNDLPATFADMAEALVPEGRALHLVDLKSHRLHRINPLDFLTWPEAMWSLMFSAKGAPNRLRPDAYRRAIAASGLDTLQMEPTGRVRPELVSEVRPHLAQAFRGLSDDDLAWEGFWLLLRRPVHEPVAA